MDSTEFDKTINIAVELLTNNWDNVDYYSGVCDMVASLHPLDNVPQIVRAEEINSILSKKRLDMLCKDDKDLYTISWTDIEQATLDYENYLDDISLFFQEYDEYYDDLSIY